MIYWLLFVTFFKVGLFTIGGGYAMLPLIQVEVVERHTWIEMTQFAEFVGIAEGTPGPFAVNIATFTGMHCAGLFGSIVATSGLVLPSLMIILAIAMLFRNFLSYQWVKNGLRGTRPIVCGLIATAAVQLAINGFYVQQTIQWAAVGFVLVLLAMVLIFKLKPLYVIILGAGLGFVVATIFKIPL